MISIEAIPSDVFGQIAEQVVNGRGGYNNETRRDVFDRIERIGETVGRTCIVKVVHDGEVGAQVVTVPKPREIVDPIAQGI